MGTAAGITLSQTELDVVPYVDSSGNVYVGNPWNPPPGGSAVGLAGDRWPVRRVTLLQPNGFPLTTNVAETIFNLRDDLAVDQPDENDRPGIQRWSTNPNGTPDDPTDDIPLSRQFKGDYSWFSTIVPQTTTDLLGLQPAFTGRALCDISVVIFRRRDTTPSAISERLIEAEVFTDGEIGLYSTSTTPAADVDAAVDDIRPGNWIALMGVNQTTGSFMLKWYRLLALDDETATVNLANSNQQGRYAMVFGDQWPESSRENLRAAIFPGAISVVTKYGVEMGGSSGQ